jgi:hypothetical protein
VSKAVCVVSSDNHLELHTWAGRPELSGDAFQSFQQLTDFAAERDLPLVLAGDVFNHAFPDAYTVWFALDRLSRISTVYTVQGQHEKQNKLAWLSLAGFRVQHVHKMSFKLGGICCYGLDFLPAADIQRELKLIPKGTDVLVAHQVWQEVMGKKAAPEAAFADVPGVRCLITGDFHGHYARNYTGADGQNLFVVSCGSQNQQTLDEPGEKFFYVLYDDLKVESIPLVTRRVVRARLQNPNTFDAELTGLMASAHDDEGLPKAIAKPIFDVKYHEGIPDARKRIDALLKDKVHLFAAPIEFRTEDNVEEIRALDNLALGLEGALEDYRNEPERYSTALRLLRADDPKTEIVQVVKEIMDAPIPDSDPFAT